MTDPLTAAELDAIEQRANAATEGPWEASAHDHAAGDVPILDRTGHYLVICPDCGVRGGYERADAEFIAHARSDVPALLAEVRRLRSIVTRWEMEAERAERHGYDLDPHDLLAVLDGGE